MHQEGYNQNEVLKPIPQSKRLLVFRMSMPSESSGNVFTNYMGRYLQEQLFIVAVMSMGDQNMMYVMD